MEMENEGQASGSSRMEDRSLPPRRSQTLHWLHTALSGVDSMIQRMLNLIEGDGETVAERAEMYYERRLELAEMLKEAHKSYCSLAQKHDRLRSHYVQGVISSRSVSTSSGSSDRAEHAKSQLSRRPGSAEDGLDLAIPTVQAESCPEDQDLTVETSKPDLLNCVTNGSPGTTCLKVAGETKEKEEIGETSEIWEETLDGLMKTQAELTGRNEEKIDKIKELPSRINLLMKEYAELKNHLSARKVDAQQRREPEESRLSRNRKD